MSELGVLLPNHAERDTLSVRRSGRGKALSGVALKRALNRWLFGEPFNLRSPLSEAECEQRIAEYNPGIIPSLMTDYTAYVFCGRVVVGMQTDNTVQFLRRTPTLSGTLLAAGNGTEIIGRSGGDSVALATFLALEFFSIPVAILYAMQEPDILLAVLLPIALFFLTRRSLDGEELVDFLRQLLEAEDVQPRRGDPIVRA